MIYLCALTYFTFFLCILLLWPISAASATFRLTIEESLLCSGGNEDHGESSVSDIVG